MRIREEKKDELIPSCFFGGKTTKYYDIAFTIVSISHGGLTNAKEFAYI